MLDIIEIKDGQDLNVIDSVVAKAANVLSIQLGSLEYAPEFGVDFKYFLDSSFQFQNESFKSYLVQRLVENQINVAQVVGTVNTFFQKYTYYVDALNTDNKGLIL